ncbi:MAG: ParB/RepB/Spo0J family partition protein, partial [Caldilineae bacterium]
MAKKKGLGRGLGALIPPAPGSDAPAGPVEIPVTRIVPNPHQPRQAMDETRLDELAASIREHGVIQPIVVTRAGDTYQIVAGERRWRAARRAGLTHVPVFVKETTPQQMLEMALVENIQRADLNPLEEAEAYAHLMNEFGLTQEEVARRVGKSRVAVANTLRLLKLPDELKAALAAGQITEGHARALLGLPDPKRQRDALKTVLQRSLNVRQTEALVRQLVAAPEKPKKKPVPLSPHDRDMLRRFQERLGTRVEMSRSDSAGEGKIIIHFYSDEELQALFDAILG